MNLNNGTFRISRPAEALRFTGERLTSAISGSIEMEHLHRYCLARDLCAGRDVLDLASGEGYGAALLAGVARHVIGVERDAEAVEHARRAYTMGNLIFQAGDALDLPLPDDTVDIVVCFETLEHLPDQMRFLAEVKRVLRPGGLFLVSTPDRLVQRELGMPPNPYHLQELSRPEFEALLEEAFANVTVLAQRTLAGSVLLGAGNRLRTYERRDATTIEATDGVARAVYLLAAASDAPLPDLPASLYADEHSVDALFAQIGQGQGEAAKNRTEAEELRDELDRLRAEIEHQRIKVEGQAYAAAADRDRMAAELDALRSATGVRVGLYVAHRASRLPAPLRKILRHTLGTALRARAALRGLPAPASFAPASLARLAETTRTVPALIAARYPALEPFPCFAEAYPRPRVSVVTDSIGPSSLFGGVGTSILLGALLATRLSATLRIVTRTEPSDAAPVYEVLANNGVAFDGVVETAFAPLDGSRDLPVAADEAFLTTSWWNTRATLGSVPRNRIVTIVQEDERMFYPQGDERLRCQETLSEPGLITAVNTEMLYRHLTGGRSALANLERDGISFEPAFPNATRPGPRSGRRRLFFYARPNNLRNLFWRGIEALDLAAAEGLFPSDRWEMHWVGGDIPEVQLPRGVVPVRTAQMGWGKYQSFIASMDAGFVLMDTPHPSYPPLDLAAAGAAVLTNTHPGKESLERYSRNILMAPPSRDGLLEGLRRLQALAEDDAARTENRAADSIGRDWTAALSPVVDRLTRHLAG